MTRPKATQRGPLAWRLLFLCALHAFLLPSAFGQDSKSEIIQGAWMMEGSPLCALQPCAEFRPQGSKKAIAQGWLGSTALVGAGELRLQSSGEVTIMRQMGDSIERLTFSGPISVFLDRNGDYYLLSPGRGNASHEGPDVSTLRHVLPPWIAGTEGTEFKFLVSPEGAVAFKVKEGQVTVRSRDPEEETLGHLAPGEGLILDTNLLTGPFSQRLDGDDGDSRWYDLMFELSARRIVGFPPDRLIDRFHGTLSAAQGGHLTDENNRRRIFAAFTDLLVSCEPADIAEAAITIDRLYPNDLIRDHILFLAWSKAYARGDYILMARLKPYISKGLTLRRWGLLFDEMGLFAQTQDGQDMVPVWVLPEPGETDPAWSGPSELPEISR